uniref:Putative trilaris n=1 Tax=Rhipicephalus pulchellus TaxID=72859 RepID=L7LQU7_RHIPC
MKFLTGKLVLLCVSCTQLLSSRASAQRSKGVDERRPKNCMKPPFVGVCRPLLTTAWYFDINRHTCVALHPGVCAGGNNLFPTLQKCTEECQLLTQKKSKVCLLPPVVGPCDPVVVSWYYDPEIDRCKAFNRTICGGGGNCYLTEMKCQWECRPKKTPEAKCSKPPKAGLCFISRNHYYFDEKSNQCLRFANNKCGSNRNAFPSVKKCLQRCSYNKPTVPCINCGQQISNELPQGVAPAAVPQPGYPGPYGQPGYPMPPAQSGQPQPSSVVTTNQTASPGQPNQSVQSSPAPPGHTVIPAHPAGVTTLGQPSMPGKPAWRSQPGVTGQPIPTIPGGLPNQPSMHPVPSTVPVNPTMTG